MTISKSNKTKLNDAIALAKSSGIFAGAQVVNIFAGLVVFGFLARNFTPEILGQIDFLTTFIIFVVNTSIFGQGTALGRLINDPISINQKRELATTSLLIQITLVFILITSFFLLFGVFIDSENIISNYSYQLLFIVLAQIPFAVVIESSIGLLLWSRYKRSFVLLSLVSSILTLILLLGLNSYKDINIFDVFIVYLLSRIIVSIFGLILCLQKSLLKKLNHINLKNIKNLLEIAWPLGLLNFLATIMPLWERILIKNYLDNYELGLFALAAKIGSIITVLGTSFNNAWGPTYIRLYETKRSKIFFKFIFKIVAIGCSILLLILTIFSSNLVSILGAPSYQDSILLILPLSIGLSLEIISYVTDIGIFISKKTIYYLISYMIFMVTFTISFLILVPRFGFISIGWSLAISYLFKAIFITVSSRLLYKVDWPYFCALVPFSSSSLISIKLYNSNFLYSDLNIKLIVLFISLFLIISLTIPTLNNFDKAYLLSIKKHFYRK